MKICFLIASTNVAGGANRSLLDLLLCLREDGHDCSVVMNAHGTMEQALDDLGVSHKVIPFVSEMKRRKLSTNLTKQAVNVYAEAKLMLYLKRGGFDLFHNNSLPVLAGMDAAAQIGLPYICHIRENIWEGLGNEFSSPKKAKRLIEGAARTIVISDYIRNTYEAFAPSARYLRIYDGIQIREYYEEKDIFTGVQVTAAIIGVINPHKNQKDAVKAVDILKKRGYGNVRLLVVGMIGKWHESRRYGEVLQEQVMKRGLEEVSFIPPIEDTEELRTLRRGCDINLICSKAEGMGRTTIESMLSGSLTIAADAGATPELIRDGETGLLYKCGDPRDLADKIEYAIKNTEQMRTIARAGQDYARKSFDPGLYGRKIEELYTEVLGGR